MWWELQWAPPGAHIIVIRVLHQKNALATGTKVVVDGFVVHG